MFVPLAYLDRVDLPEFGCEGRPETGRVYGAVWGRRADGARLWRIEETALLLSGFCDDMWVGLVDGRPALAPSGRSEWRPAAQGAALRAVLQEPGLLL